MIHLEIDVSLVDRLEIAGRAELLAGELFERVYVGVGDVVRGEDYDCILQLAGGLKLFDEDLHGLVAFHGSHLVGFGLFRISKSQDSLVVDPVGSAGAPCPAGVGVRRMAGDRQIVYVKRLVAVDVVVHGVLNHEGVSLHPAELALVETLGAFVFDAVGVHLVAVGIVDVAPVVTEVGVRAGAAVHVDVVVVAVALIAQTVELPCQREVGVGLKFAGAAHGYREAALRVQSKKMLTFAVGRAGEVQGGVVVVEHEALVRYLPKRRRKHRIQSIAGQTFNGKEYDVVAFEHAGVFVLHRRRHGAEVLRQLLDIVVAGVLLHLLKVQGYLVGLVLADFRIVGLVRRNRLVRRNDYLAFDRPDHMLDIKPEHVDKSELLHLVVVVGVRVVKFLWGEVALEGYRYHKLAQEEEYDRKDQRQYENAALFDLAS